MKNSVVLFTDDYDMLCQLNAERVGNVMMAVYAYELGLDIPELDMAESVAFAAIKKHLDATDAQYNATVEARKEAGKKSAEKRTKLNKTEQSSTKVNKAEQTSTTLNKAEQSSTKSTDTDTVTDTDIKETLSNESVKKNAPAHKYGEYGNVLLTDSQLVKLKEDYGESEALKAIDYLDQYIKRKGYKAKDHYLTIRKWVFDALKEDELKAAELKEREARIKARGKPPDKHGIQRGIDYDKLLIDAQKEAL